MSLSPSQQKSIKRQTKCKAQTIEFTKRFKLKGNTPKFNKLKAELTSIINRGGNSEDILNIEGQIKELVDEDVA